MILRKERTHHTGSSNLLNKTERLRPVTQPGQSRLSLLSQPKIVNQVDEVIERKATRVVATPFEKTRSFYGEHNKPEHPKTQISKARTLQLEDPDKMRMPFTGESLLIFDKNLGQYRDPDSPIRRKNKDVADKEHLAKEKHEIHAKAIQETQLVGYDNYGLDTLKNNVNLQKVREAKRLLRRKYANRKNMHMIFSSWDYDRTGTISIANLYTMAKRLGLNLNYDEARVLLASADRNGSATLSLDEFLDLIHNKDDMLNLDLDKLAKYSVNYHLNREDLEGENDENIIKQLEVDAKKGREVKHFNQVNMILKNKMNEIVSNFLLTDPHKNGYATYDTFEQNLKKLGVDEKLVSHEDIKALFHKFKTDDHTIHYKNFIDGLKGFNFMLEDAYKEYENPAQEQDSAKNFRSAPVKKLPEDEEPHIDIVDVRAQPYSTVYTYLAKKRKVSRLIQKFFPKKEDLENYLTQTVNTARDDKDNLLMTKNQTRDAIVNLFKKFDVKNLTQRDFEGFLSSFVYSKHNFTHMSEVLNGIYDEDEDALIDKVNTRKKGPAPHKSIAFEQRAITEGDGEELDQETKQKKINEILNKIDERIFVERKRAYDLYKMFDVDNDGFISRKDFITKAEEMSLVPREDIKVLVDYLDSQNKGYVNFREFHQKIYTNATQQDENANPKVFPSVMPSKENFLKTAGFGPMTKKKVDEMINELRPQTSGFLRPSSRFGSTPVWKNTFQSFQPNITSPMFVSDRDRFNCSPLANVLPSVEEKDKKRRIQSAKLDVLKHTQAAVQRRADEDMNKFDLLDQNRLKTKVSALATHEQNARLRNNYS